MNLNHFESQFYETTCEHCNTQWLDNLVPPKPVDYIYDLECYPNIFTFAIERKVDGARWFFEISDWVNQSNEIIAFLNSLKNSNGRMIGFNSLGYDYPLLHFLYVRGYAGPVDMYQKSISIINTDFNEAYKNRVRLSDIVVPQVDLLLVHHFDNKAKRTGLKHIECAMKLPSISNLPFPPGTVINYEQREVLINYNWDDIDATREFYTKSIPHIELRERLSKKYDFDFTNANDGKIGEKIIIMKLEQAGVPCFNSWGDPVQTVRDNIVLADAVLPHIRFEHHELNRIKNFFTSHVITETKGVFKDLTATIDGFTFVFGAGGLHGSVSSQTIISNDEYAIIDLDVISFYPRLSMVNKFFPAHLSEVFCDVYEDIYNERMSYKKGTPENAALKYSLNIPYGKSNSKYSSFFDSLFTMKITLNGQLFLCMLAEQLMKVPNLTMIQANTDGVTFKVHRSLLPHIEEIRAWWEWYSGLQLEEVEYNRMFIRDVNNYIGEYTDGKLKRKGAYEYNLDWHKNHSQLIVPKAAEAALVRGEDIESFIRNHDDLYDFMLFAKATGKSRIVLNKDEVDYPQQKISRYYVTTTGGSLVKIMPPLAKNAERVFEFRTYTGDPWYAHNEQAYQHAMALGFGYVGERLIPGKDRRIGVSAGQQVTVCNNIYEAVEPINIQYYIDETNKLVDPLRN